MTPAEALAFTTIPDTSEEALAWVEGSVTEKSADRTTRSNTQKTLDLVSKNEYITAVQKIKVLEGS